MSEELINSKQQFVDKFIQNLTKIEALIRTLSSQNAEQIVSAIDDTSKKLEKMKTEFIETHESFTKSSMKVENKGLEENS